MRQDTSAVSMIWDITRLIFCVSQITLKRGDQVMTSTPPGVKAGHKMEGESGFLNAGDVLASEIEDICTLRNTILDTPDAVHWDRDRSREMGAK